MVRFQNRRNRTRWTSDVFWIMRSAIGTLPGLARTTVGHNTAPDHLALEAKQTTRRQGGGELVVEEEMKVHELLNNGVKRCQHTKMLSDSSVWGKSVIRRIG